MDMTQDQIQQMIDDAINAREVANGYGVSLIPYHVHNGTDTGQVDYNNLVNKPATVTVDWTYVSKKTYAATSGIQTWSGLTAHDEWLVRFNLTNTGTTNRIDPLIQLNGITSTANYSGTLTNNNSITTYTAGTYAGFIALSMLGDAYVNIIGDMYVTGKHYQGVKGARGVVGRGSTVLHAAFLHGAMVSDSNDVSSISINVQASATGQAELYYRDNR